MNRLAVAVAVVVSLTMATEAEFAMREIADDGKKDEDDRQRQHRVDVEEFGNRPIARGDQQSDDHSGQRVAERLGRDFAVFGIELEEAWETDQCRRCLPFEVERLERET